jgi:hypothetical protein
MGKETSIADEKQSAQEARHVERLERITKRDTSVEEMSRPPELQAYQRKDRTQRVSREKRATPRDAWSLALASVDEMSSPPELQGNDSQANDSKEALDRCLSVNPPDGKQGAREARRSDRKDRIAKRAPGELDESKGGSNVNEEADTPGAFAFNRDKSDRKDDEHAEDETEDKKLDLVVAAEISPDNADIEAQLDEKLRFIKKQLLEDLLLHVPTAEVVEEEKPPRPRRCFWIHRESGW